MLVTEIFIRSLVEKYERHTVYTDDGNGIMRHAMEMVSWDMQCNWIQTLFTFTIREKFDGKGNQ